MTEHDRFIGKFEGFIEWEKTQHEKLDKRFDSLEMKVDQLREWRWRIVGGAAVVSAIVAAVVRLIN